MAALSMDPCPLTGQQECISRTFSISNLQTPLRAHLIRSAPEDISLLINSMTKCLNYINKNLFCLVVQVMTPSIHRHHHIQGEKTRQGVHKVGGCRGASQTSASHIQSTPCNQLPIFQSGLDHALFKLHDLKQVI